MFSIPCKQFVYGKMLGASLGSYKVVASSDNMLDEFVTEVRRIFQGCRPKSIDVKTFATTLIATPFAEKYLILLRMEHFHDHDLGHFIQEHYVVVEKEHLSQEVVTDHFESKPWFWLLNIPNIQLYSSFGKLSNTISLSLNAGFLTQIGNITSLLSSGDGVFEDTLRNTMTLLLNTPPAVIQVKDDDHLDKQFWCIALSLLLPAEETSNLRIFIGGNLPDHWSFELGIVTQNSLNQKTRLSDQISIQPVNRDNEFLKFSILVKRWLNLSKSKRFISDLIDVIDNVKVDWQSPTIQNYQTNRDVAFGISAMSTLGLNLAREEVARGIIDPAELQWIWRNMSHRNGEARNLLRTDDLLNFLPILIRENLDNWNRDDFAAFGDIVSTHLTEPERLFTSFENNDEILLKFLHRWIKTNDFSNKEEKLFLLIMKKVAFEKFATAVELFLKWIENNKKRNINPFYFLSELVKVQREPISAIDITKLFFICCYYLLDNGDLNLFEKAILGLSIENDANEYRNIFLLFLAGNKDQRFPESELLDTFQYLLDAGQKVGLSASDIVFALFHVFIVTRNAKMFEVLTMFAHLRYHKLLHFPVRKDLENEWRETVPKWVSNSGDTSLFAAYIYILMQFVDGKTIQGILTNLLVESPKSFSEVVGNLFDIYSVERENLKINLHALEDLDVEKRFWLLSEFLFSARSKTYPPTINEVGTYYKTILAVDNIKMVEAKKQPYLIMIFQASENYNVCQRIVEHQIRDALNQKPPNFEKAKEKLRSFKIIMRQTKASWGIKSKLQPDIMISLSYLRGLNETEFQSFLQWFLKEPFNSPLLIATQHYPATANLVKLNTHWMTSDPFVRLRLFEEVINILQ